jgi:hypothetical protein
MLDNSTLNAALPDSAAHVKPAYPASAARP